MATEGLAKLIGSLAIVVKGAEIVDTPLSLISDTVAVYRHVQHRRIREFLAIVDYEIAKEGNHARARVEDIIASEAGAEVLAEFGERAPTYRRLLLRAKSIRPRQDPEATS